MRQLDLFTSLFETPPQETKPAEGGIVLEKEKERAPVAEIASSFYSKNVLRSERKAASLVLAKESDAAIVDLPSSTEDAYSPDPSAINLSLFNPLDSAFTVSTDREVGGLLRETESSIVTAEAEVVSDQEQPGTNASPVLAGLIETISEKPFVPVAPLKKVESAIPKRVSEPKRKKANAPELERSGSVIFDDGKISVKLKSSSPFPPPVVKVKKAKENKIPQKRGRKSFKEIDAEVDLIEIPDDEVLFQKQYYPISEVAKWFRVNTSLLRFWENEFDVLKPRKNRKGDRLFRPEDVKNLQLIYQLLRQRKYTIEGAKEYIKTNKKKADIQLYLTNTLQKFKSFLLDMKSNLQP